MARELKTRFPCKWGCGTLAPVARLKDAPRAECEPCAYRRHAEQRVGWADWAAREHIENAEKLRDDPKAKPSLRYLPAKPEQLDAQLVEWLEAAGERIHAASRAVQAISLNKGADRRRFARIAKNRANLAKNIVEQLAEHLDALIERQGLGLKVVDPAPAKPEQGELEVLIAMPPPVLRLVKAIEPVAPPDGAER
jgi:hypothetical protein